MTDILSDLEEKARAATQGTLSVNRYDHGGGRLFIKEPLQLIADLYDEGNREYYAAFSPSIALKLLKIARAAQEIKASENVLACTDFDIMQHPQSPEAQRSWDRLKMAEANLDDALAALSDGGRDD